MIIREIFEDRSMSFDDVVKLSQSSVVDTEAVDQMLEEAPDAETALNNLAGTLWRFDAEQKVTAKSTAARAGRHYGAPWFCAYLAQKGYVLLPEMTCGENILPRLLTPLLWTLFIPEKERNLAKHLIRHPGKKSWAYSLPVFRELVFRTNFFQSASSGFTLAHFFQLKRCYTTVETGSGAPRASADQLGHGLNRIFEAYLDFHGKTWEDGGPDARFFGGGRSLTGDHGREAFAWVENPGAHKLTRFRKLIDGNPPTHFSEFIQEWARDLRSLLPMFEVQAPSRQIDHLSHWLIFLIKLGDSAPKSWQEIDRELHINHVGMGTHLTFIGFVRQLDKANRQGIVSDLQKAWNLAALRDGFASKLSCPIDFRIDHLGWAESNTGRTRRKFIPEQVHKIVVEENRRDGFAFARSLAVSEGPRKHSNIHWRTVIDPDSGERLELFWPGVPIVLDMMLSMGMRQSSAMWMDSGEGDEFWVDPERIEIYPNPLPSRTKNRSAGFLRVCQVGPKAADKVLGMYLAVNKTGPYQLPWVDPGATNCFISLRDWQARWNPRRAPLKASRSDIQLQYAAEGTIPEVYPLFRDPESRSSHPPTTATIYSYWAALLRHCEPIVREKLGYEEPLILNGRPRWDLHSLRVTTVSTLLENGVEPWIVAELVGHTSVAMTWHYKDVDPRKTHAALQQAHERRRRQAIEDLQDLGKTEFIGSEDKFEAKVRSILGGLVRLRGDNTGAALLRTSVAEGGSYEMFSHGICPGGDCKTGGEIYKNASQPVFRPRACSRCRYRLTGPAFLAGLVHRMNGLMVEIKASTDQEASLNRDIEEAEDRGDGHGGAVRVLRALIMRQRELRDELYAEWCAEMATIWTAERMLDRSGDGSKMPIFTGLDLGNIRTQTDTVHQLALLHTVIADGNLILGAALEVPHGLRERRDALLLEVARHNDLGACFYKLAPSRRTQALNQFGDLLLDHVRDAEGIQRLLNGDMAMSDVPALDTEIRELLSEEIAGLPVHLPTLTALIKAEA